MKTDFSEIKLDPFVGEVNGVPIKTLAFTFPERRRILSTREGFREVEAVAENSCPPELWDFVHRHPQDYFEMVQQAIHIEEENISLLYTGASLEKGSLKKSEQEEVLVFATADVKTNAMRTGIDAPSGTRRQRKPGTINIFLLTTSTLSEAAMARSLITVTEAKTAALQDLHIQSSYDPALQATGTGTDNIVVVSGTEPSIE
ncbi:MAG: adenosylcobinamide amidohydrolase [Dehalococcoidia bacterium]